MSRDGYSVMRAILKWLAEEEEKDGMEQQRVKGSTETAEPTGALTARQ